ncbi:MAG: SDR family NAD(P)-dependent oxidoreductase [Pseudomonadota bacterium]
MFEQPSLASFPTPLNTAIFGANGGIGGALADLLEANPGIGVLHRFARSSGGFDLTDEASIAAAAASIETPLHIVIVATGMLHQGEISPEKTWRALAPEAMMEAYRVNTIGPALIAKHMLPLLAREGKSIFAALSARVGSIGDNRLGGWHSYRASKAALNMMIRNFAIELARRNKTALAVGLHPGTVDTGLSKPFQGKVQDLFSPRQSATKLLNVLDGLVPADSGGCFAHDGVRIAE